MSKSTIDPHVTQADQNLNALCQQYLNTDPSDKETRNRLHGEIYLAAKIALADLIAGQKYGSGKARTVDGDRFDDVLIDKLDNVLQRENLRPHEFNKILARAVKNGLIDVQRQLNGRPGHVKKVRQAKPFADFTNNGNIATMIESKMITHGRPSLRMEASEASADMADELLKILWTATIPNLELLVDHYANGMTLDAIAKKQTKPRGTIGSDLVRVLKKLRASPELREHLLETDTNILSFMPEIEALLELKKEQAQRGI